MPRNEELCFRYGRMLDETYKKPGPDVLPTIIEFYCKCLIKGNAFVVIALPRVIRLWLDLGNDEYLK